jgi:hypothetical protein
MPSVADRQKEGPAMIRSASDPGARPPLVISEVTDPELIARWNVQRAQADRNWAWLKANADKVYSRSRGKYYCIAGQKLFVGDTLQEARAAARSEYPDDKGYLTRYVPAEKRVRI